MKNNPFGKSDARFEYQKEKIDKERDGPTGDFNIHMHSVVDKDVEKKRDAIQWTIQVAKQQMQNLPNAVFASGVNRYNKSDKDDATVAALKKEAQREAQKQAVKMTIEHGTLVKGTMNTVQSQVILGKTQGVEDK